MASNLTPPEKTPPDKNPFDVKLVKQLVSLMKENDLSEITLAFERARVRIRRGGLAAIPTTAYTVSQPSPQPQIAASTSPADNAAAPAKPAEPTGTFIKSPTVGTFYFASSPEAPPFVKIGDAVKPDTIVCMVEAMKVFNEIPAGLAGTILEFMVENAAPVEFGQPLFRVKPV